MNKQTIALITWAKKYLDVNSEVETLIENRKILIRSEQVFNQIHLLISIDNDDVDFYWCYDFDTVKWSKKVL